MSEEELYQCIESVVPKPSPPPEIVADCFPSQCDQKFLKAILRAVIKTPVLRENKDIKHVLDKVKTNKKIEGIILQRVKNLIKE